MSVSTLNLTSLAPKITSLGVGSGLDLNSIVSQLVAVESQPMTQLQSAASTLQTTISDYGQISSLMNTLQTSASALANVTLWSQQSATSSNSGGVAVSVGSGAVSGNYAVSVQSLANAQTVASASSYSSAGATVGSGTLTFQLGAWDAAQANFTPQSGSSSVSVAVTPTDTLQTISDKVNALGLGVTASLVTDASGTRLAFTSTSTGSSNGFRIQAADDDGNNTDAGGLSALAYDPASGTAGTVLGTAASNATAIINGISVSSATNTLASAVPGLTLTLGQVSATPVNIAVSANQASISSAITTFVSSFNALSSYLGTATAYDATTKTAGDLQGDNTANSLQRLLRANLSATTGASSVFKTLSDVGLQFQRDGTISIDQPTLNSALNNLPELKKAFTNIDTTTPGNNGLAQNFVNFTQQALGVNGLVTTATSGLQAQLTDNGNQQSDLTNRISAYQTTLVAQYTALDTQIAQLNALSSYVTQQLASITGTKTN